MALIVDVTVCPRRSLAFLLFGILILLYVCNLILCAPSFRVSYIFRLEHITYATLYVYCLSLLYPRHSRLYDSLVTDDYPSFSLLKEMYLQLCMNSICQ